MGLSVLALNSCTDNSLYTAPATCEAIITGNTYTTTSDENPVSDNFSTMESGSQVLLNASGSLQINNEVLTYSANQWKTENPLYWTDITGEASVTALSPVYPNLTYMEEDLYRNNLLEDILYIKDIFPAGNEINFRFKHLFSLLTLHLNGELQSNFQKIEIICPVVVAQVLPESAQIIFNNDKSHIASIIESSPSGDYSFIIPPAENITITINILTSEKKYITHLQSRSFTGNRQYKCNLKTSENTPGIVTPEDWIAFSKLINNIGYLSEYNGKTLKDFGETINGVTTYRLSNNIDFEGVNCKNLEHIGIKDNDRFEDIFDGQGHSISNFTPKSSDGTTGLFGVIGTNSIIKNLHLKSCNTKIGSGVGSKLGAGLLVGVNNGTIMNCSIEDGAIQSELNTFTGGLVGDSRGSIINCCVLNTNLSSVGSTGGLVGNSYGVILNCYSGNNIINGKSNNGGISGRSITSPTTIRNCYVHSPSMPKRTNSGLFFGGAKNDTITNCFYSTVQGINIIGKTENSGNITSEVIPYNSDFTIQNGETVFSKLNQWITNTAPTLYPDITFTRWISGEKTLPAVFISRTE